MKKAEIKTIKETSIVLECGIDFEEKDIEQGSYGMQQVNREKLEQIVRENFNHINYPRISHYGIFDEVTKTQSLTVVERLYL